jgi:hypothetical protein
MQKRTFKLNTAITAVDPEMGKFNEDAHRRQVLPLRGKIMAVDGMTGCYIERYEIEVSFLDDVTTEREVDMEVRASVCWARDQDGFFPLRGSKKPQATLKPPSVISRDPNVIVRFNSDIVPYPPSDTEEFDSKRFREMTKPIAEDMTRTDGVVAFELRLSSASITYDPNITNGEVVEAHLREVFEKAAEAGVFFPFLDENKPFELIFE